MIIPIKSFNQIDIIPDSLVVLDIDDTVLTYPQLTKNWWKEKINYYCKTTNDIELSEKHTLSEWFNIVQTTNPKKLDSEEQNNFINKLYQNNCQLIFLTARNKDMTEITYEHLSYIGINKAHSVYFDENKGEKICELISDCYANVDNIIFVDDLTNNHNKILNAVKKYNIKTNFKLYQIDHDY